MRGNTALLIFSAEFGALFSHHWNGFYKEMEIERQQRPILQHVSADYHFPSLSRRQLLKAVGLGAYRKLLRVNHMRLRPLRSVVRQVTMHNSIINYRRNNDDCGTATSTNVVPLGSRPVFVSVANISGVPSAIHMNTVDTSRTATEGYEYTAISSRLRSECSATSERLFQKLSVNLRSRRPSICRVLAALWNSGPIPRDGEANQHQLRPIKLLPHDYWSVETGHVQQNS